MSSILADGEDQRVADGVLDGLNNYFPLTSANGTLRMDVEKVFVDRSKDRGTEPGYITNARYEGKSYELPIRATVAIFQVSGDTEKLVNRGTFDIGPYFPPVEGLGTRLVSGSIYQNRWQVRRRPGVYAFHNAKGQSLVEMNSSAGSNFNLVMDVEEKQIPTIDILFTGAQRKKVGRGAYALLRAFGATDEQLKQAWGDLYVYNAFEVVDSHKVGSRPVDLVRKLRSIYTGITPNNIRRTPFEGGSFAAAAEQLVAFMTERDAFDPRVNERTMGMAAKRYSVPLLLEASKRLAAIYTGAETPPARFSERFRILHGLDTQIREGLILDKKIGDAIRSKAQDKLDKAEANIGRGMTTTDSVKAREIFAVQGVLHTKIRGLYTASELSTATETTNILDIDNRNREVTLKGQGGVRSSHAVSADTIALHPSRLGLMDPVQTQVSAPGVTVPLAGAAVQGERGEMNRLLFDRELGRVRAVTSEESDDSRVGFMDEFEATKGEGGKVVLKPRSSMVLASDGDHIRRVPEKEVRYVLDPTDMFSDGVNIIPFLAHNSGPRAIFGANQMGQALSLADREAPLVDTTDAKGERFTKRIGDRFNVQARIEGTVISAADDLVKIRDADGKVHDHPLFRNFPLNQGGFLDQKATVKKDDVIKKGHVLTTNNYTDDGGHLSLGRNLLTAYVAWKGFNFEDGIVISEGAAKKLGAQHLEELKTDLEPHDEQSVTAFQGAFSQRGKEISSDNINKLDHNGIIKTGETVVKGDILVPIVSNAFLRNDPEADAMLRSALQDTKMDVRDKSIRWNHDYPGEVVKVHATPTRIRVFVRTTEPFKEGNKLSGRHGEKGIVSKILPDDQMPRLKSGEVVEMLVDPHGVPSRANPGQILELAAGKVAKKTGQTYLLNNFKPGGVDRLKADMKRLGISDKEDLIAPDGTTIPQIAVGWAYKAQLKHQLDHKFHVRKMHDGYNLHEQPRGGAAIDALTVYALLGHGARANLSEMARLKGTNNSDYWNTLANGGTPPKVTRVPFAFQKFSAMIEGMGIQVRKRGDELELFPMTDAEVIRRSAGAIKDSQTYQTHRAAGPSPMKAGLFDPHLVGVDKANWNHINLPEPMPNPLFSKAIHLLLTKGQGLDGLEVIRDGKAARPVKDLAQVDIEGIYLQDVKLRDGKGKEFTGGDGLKTILARVDLRETERVAREEAERLLEKETFDGDKLNAWHSVSRYASSLLRNKIKPEDGFMMTKVPVIPAKFRNILMGPRDMVIPPENKLYASLLSEVDSLKSSIDNRELAADQRSERDTAYRALNALVGGKGHRPVGKFEATSLMSQIASPRLLQGSMTFGQDDTDAKGPKAGYPQKRVIRRKMELSGRSTIIPSGLVKIDDGDALDVDQVGLPEEMAWELYRPMLLNRLSNNLGSVEALKAVKARSSQALQMLEQVMDETPALLNRAPSWWPYNIMAFRPKLIKKVEGDRAQEKAIRIPNLVVGPYFGGDYDGDALSVHIPVEPEAVAEAWKMLPSKHLIAPGSKRLMIEATQSQLLGLYRLTTVDMKAPVMNTAYSSPQAAADAMRKGEVQPSQRISMVPFGVTTVGWMSIEAALRKTTGGRFGLFELFRSYEEQYGEKVDFMRFAINKGNAKKLFTALVTRFPDVYTRVVQEMARQGEEHATRSGATVGLSDLSDRKDLLMAQLKRVEPHIAPLAKELAKLRADSGRGNTTVTPDDMRAARIKLFTEQEIPVGKNRVQGLMPALQASIAAADPKGNQLLEMMTVGSKGNKEQMMQLLAGVVMVSDVNKNAVDEPILSSYSSGLKAGEYFLQQHGALGGLRDRSVETKDPGDLGKQIVASSQEMLITENDCGTVRGVDLPVFIPKDRDKDWETGKEEVPNPDADDRYQVGSGLLVTPSMLVTMQRGGQKTIKVRSVLTCEAEHGVCARCYGLMHTGQPPALGTHVGILEGQSIVEASTKMTLKAFHTGGSADKSAPSFARLREITYVRKPEWKASVVEGKRGDEVTILNTEPITSDGRTAGNRVVYKYETGKKAGQEGEVRVGPQNPLIEGLKGMRLTVGDRVSEGHLDPRYMMKSHGIEKTRTYLTDELHKIMSATGGIKRRAAEMAVAAMSQYGRVTKAGDGDFFPGDFVRFNKVEAYNKNRKPGEREATVERDIFATHKAPTITEDWLAKMNFRGLSRQLTTGAIQGQRANIHGANPISAYMYGAEFNDASESKGWKY